LPQLQQKIGELEDLSSAPDFWFDQERARRVNKKINYLRKTIENWSQIEKSVEDLGHLAELNQQERDAAIGKDVKNKLVELREQYEEYRLRTLLSGPYDDHDCLLSIHAGAGGTDAQDWAQMLLRMYLRYSEKNGYQVEMVDKSEGGEAGIKSVVLEISGPYAFGHFKGEAGVHRLIRLSPYNPAHTRETSFALVEVLPELEQHEELAINPKDLKIEVSTARGHGGQSVNTTYSAVRITHIPTGIKASIQNERSQAQNKARALKIIQGKLRLLEEQKRQAEKLKIRGEFHSAEWGNQIRSYTLHPYKLVKDHRSGYETSAAEDVLEGNLNQFIASNLEYQKSKTAAVHD